MVFFYRLRPMASSSSPHGSYHHSEPAKMEQIITEFFAKSLHIILDSRAPPCASSRNYSGDHAAVSPASSSSSSSSVRPRDKWFNLALRECPAAMENLDFWRHSNLEPMFVDVVLVQRPMNYWNLGLGQDGQDEILCESKSQRIVERWIVQYESRKSREFNSGGSKRSSCTSSHSLYKKCIILLRSLYLTVRILPVYKLFRDLNSSGKIKMFSLGNRVSSFVEPFTPREEAEMKKFEFNPVDTTCGRLCLSVLYYPTLDDMRNEPLTPLSQQVIADYVGSPTTNPLKRFPSLPGTGLVSFGSPSQAPFPRVRSCGYELYRASAPSVSCSPSPTNLNSHGYYSNQSSYRHRQVGIPHYPLETSHSRNVSLVRKKNTSFDEYWPPLMFCPSPSPSPPTHFPSNNLSTKALLRSESAPERESIPRAKLGRSPVFANCNIPPLSPSPKCNKPGCSSQSQLDRPFMRLADMQPCAIIQKTSSFGKDEIENLSGAKLSPNSSPRVSFSRSSCFTDDDSDFPFAFGDDEDITDPRFRPESFDGKVHQGELLKPGGLLPLRRSQDAAIGDLVRMLKAAPPLQQDFSNSIKFSQGCRLPKKLDDSPNSDAGAVQNTASDLGITQSCGLHMSKTTAEALDELQNYRTMKELLLRQCERKFSESQTLENE